MIYGYCRVSTPRQKIERQSEKIQRLYPDAIIYSDKYTGATQNRPQWNRLMGSTGVKPGDTIIFDQVSRMSRNAEEGYRDYMNLYNKKVNLIFLEEPHINTEVYRSATEKLVELTDTDVDLILTGVNNFLARIAERQIQIAFEQAEFELKDIHRRTSEGVRRAKVAGARVGQPKGAKLVTKKSKEKKEVILKHSLDFGGTLKDTELMKMTQLARKTYYKYKRELKEELAQEYQI